MTVTALLLLAALPIHDGQEGRREADPLPDRPEAEITARELHHHVAFLASDELRGRSAGSREANRAAAYLARALEAAGVEPAGDGGTYLQRVPMVRVEHRQPPRLEIVFTDGSTTAAINGIDVTVSTRGVPGTTELLPVRVVRSAEELPAEPNPGEALYLAGSRRERSEWLQGLDGYEDAWGLLLSTGPGSPGRETSLPRARVQAREEPDPCDSTRLRGEYSDALEKGRIGSVRLVYDATVEPVDDYNVVGRLRGAGTAEQPDLAREAIVFSAHYDHIGTREATQEGDDVVFNGADDDASGTAAVLELAQALAADRPPARTLLFLLAAGEEIGLVGTRYYLEHPAVPLADTVCNLNFEMIGRPDEVAGGTGKLWLTGFERSTLGPRFQEAGLALIQDPRPEQRFFQRSDNYAFALRGIVAQTLSSYNMHEDYHQVTDEVDTLDFEHMQAALRDAYRAARFLVDGSLRPEWLPGGRPADSRRAAGAKTQDQR